MVYVFRRDLARIRKAVVDRRDSPTSTFTTAAWTGVGVALTAVVGLIGFFASKPRPAPWEASALWAILVGAVVDAVVCAAARRYFRREDQRASGQLIEELETLEYAGSAAETVTAPASPTSLGTHESSPA